jgi:hypothetical protein
MCVAFDGHRAAGHLNPQFFAFRELRALLVKLGEGDERLGDLAASVQRRPRRGGQSAVED